MSEEEWQAFDHLRKPDNNLWEDIDNNTMDIDQILDGTAPVDLSYEGGEFYELVENCINKTVIWVSLSYHCILFFFILFYHRRRHCTNDRTH